MKISDMDLLVRVAETGSMTRTARQVHLTPAAVSATVRRVEEALGLRLFHRTTRALRPTDEGLVVIDGCQEVVERWRRTLEDVHGSARDLVGTVNVSAPADTCYQMLTPVVRRLNDDHPKLQVVVHSSDAITHLHRDAIDMAIRYGPLNDSSLTVRRLATWPGILVAAPSYLRQHGVPETPAALAEHRCITLQLASTVVTSWTLVRGDVRRHVLLQSPLCGDGYLARKWAIAGMGVAMKNLFDVVDDLAAGRLVRVLSDYITRQSPIHAVFTSARYFPARVRALDAAVTGEFVARSTRCGAWLASSQAPLPQ